MNQKKDFLISIEPGKDITDALAQAAIFLNQKHDNPRLALHYEFDRHTRPEDLTRCKALIEEVAGEISTTLKTQDESLNPLFAVALHQALELAFDPGTLEQSNAGFAFDGGLSIHLRFTWSKPPSQLGHVAVEFFLIYTLEPQIEPAATSGTPKERLAQIQQRLKDMASELKLPKPTWILAKYTFNLTRKPQVR